MLFTTFLFILFKVLSITIHSQNEFQLDNHTDRLWLRIG